jgi:DMSO/TMAO reductase YedYZ molybdopterin-dependent catalytic subunit
MERVEVPAVLQCSGNGRFFFGTAFPTASHPAGAQWLYGSVGLARWGGVRVRDLLDRAGVKAFARYSNNYGLDNPVLPTTPKFVRGIEIEKLLDPDTILAYEMNGEPLSYYHGYPVRLMVPGWAADHSVKWITNMTIAAEITTNFWTSTGYRYPKVLRRTGCRRETARRASHRRDERQVAHHLAGGRAAAAQRRGGDGPRRRLVGRRRAGAPRRGLRRRRTDMA